MLGFVPSHSVPNIPEALDPFLHPLMDDICTGFINGFKVNFHTDIGIDNYEPKEVENVRTVLFCFAGDHPGLREVGKLLNQGKCACRRCKMVNISTIVPTNICITVKIAFTTDIHGSKETFLLHLHLSMTLRMKQEAVFGNICHQN